MSIYDNDSAGPPEIHLPQTVQIHEGLDGRTPFHFSANYKTLTRVRWINPYPVSGIPLKRSWITMEGLGTASTGTSVTTAKQRSLVPSGATSYMTALLN